MEKGKVLSLEDRIPKIKEHRRRKANRRLIFLISLFFLLIVIVVYFQSPLSHVKEIRVHGNESISQKEAAAASGLKKGLNIWKIDKDDARKRIERLPAVKSAKVSLGFPNIVNIHLKEHATIAYMISGTHFYPVLDNGKVIKEDGDPSHYVSAPLLADFKEDETLEEMARELKLLPEEISAAISEIHYTPKKTDRYHIHLYMNDGFEVSATIMTFSEKMVHYPSIISQLDPDVKGVIDLEVGSYFKAYETEGEAENEEEDEG
ncbi:MAG TPA: cell division protein FtsQ/DivIB [Bacillaceae bacterium]